MPKLSLTFAAVLTMGLCFAQSGAYAQAAEDALPLAAEPPEGAEPTHTAEQPEPLAASEPASEGQVWAVLYDDGMSLTTASERMARSLAEAEHQRGRRVTVRRLDDVETHPRGAEKPAHPGERVAMVRSGREAPISRRYRARAGQRGAPTARRSPS